MVLIIGVFNDKQILHGPDYRCSERPNTCCMVLSIGVLNDETKFVWS
jgi:hypothetical protein